MKNITIFTTFQEADPAYSLNRVVLDQLKMFLHAGYKPRVVVAQGFKPVEEYKKVECIEIPNVTVSNELIKDGTHDEDIKKLKEAIKPILDSTDIMITHDLVYQPAALKHNIAIRELVEDQAPSQTRFIHWIHSATEPAMIEQIRGGGQTFLETLATPFPNSFYIAFNKFSFPRIAKWFGVEESLVKYCPHPHDFTEFFDPQAKKLIEDNNILEKDVVIAYPIRLDRGKQVEYTIKIAAAVKETGRSIALIIVDFHSTGGDKITYRNELKNMAIQAGLSENECIFASEMNGADKPIVSFPHQFVSNLFEITNTFILPSKSETYSLIAQEAAVRRNFCILNQDFPPFRSIYGDEPYYRQFSSNIDALSAQDGATETKYADEAQYWIETAHYINFVQENTRVLALSNRLRKERNLHTVFKKHIEPIIHADNKLSY